MRSIACVGVWDWSCFIHTTIYVRSSYRGTVALTTEYASCRGRVGSRKCLFTSGYAEQTRAQSTTICRRQAKDPLQPRKTPSYFRHGKELFWYPIVRTPPSPPGPTRSTRESRRSRLHRSHCQAERRVAATFKFSPWLLTLDKRIAHPKDSRLATRTIRTSKPLPP